MGREYSYTNSLDLRHYDLKTHSRPRSNALEDRADAQDTGDLDETPPTTATSATVEYDPMGAALGTNTVL